jgi:putative transposase
VLARWVQVTYQVSERRVSRVSLMARASLRFQGHRDPQEVLRMRLRELAVARVRFGYRRLTVLLRRDRWWMNAERIYRLYKEEWLMMRTKHCTRAAGRARVPQTVSTAPNQRWSMDCIRERRQMGDVSGF